MTADQTAFARSSGSFSRRSFLGRSSAAIAGVAGAAGVLRPALAQSTGQPAPSDRVIIGLIGCGRRGLQLLEAAAKVPGLTVSLVCDVDAERSAAAAERVMQLQGRRPGVTSDYRDLLDDADINGVIIATPDHWHATQLLHACAAGKDVYLEPPVSLTPLEAKAMVFVARKYSRVVQVGLQQRAARKFAEGAGIVRSGNLGRIAQTRTWTFARSEPITAQPDAAPPPSLDYDRWLGPAPERPFNPVRYAHPEHCWDYGGGEAACWGVHFQDLLHAAMNVSVPRSVVAFGGNQGLADGRETPDTLEALFEYASPTGTFMHAYSLRLSNAYAGFGPAALPPLTGHTGPLPARSGVQILGTEKTLYFSGRRLLLLPAGEESPIEDLAYLGIGSREVAAGESAAGPDPLTVAHVQEFAACIRSRKDPSASIEAGQSASFPLMAANIAYRVGRKLYINPNSFEFYSDPELQTPDKTANELAIRAYRASYPPPNV
ncbi:MAG TPA: Gfo/Idh/MocA family oxidoreductase [Phycisphaerae bacterium]|nr:Gfo/Idh/MocA family oxidoreductase [Phycisphaerae bacterium]HOJ73877.1 Gfo/Idh/MocA family oxidoreductase [Phycisphaerae bacterium]HOM50818.1 Gfo/Idh/MocA family oxidoreductase [Phycisphaerae bacterium]HPP26007.1 Gfo/Idh/MocA family oxidoreductase [Phycisphaerae bacterium]HPU27004.1 Gfo/Idh/MocA family oxidoreductase [Phycisphaerae bacterium]